jgi:rSAM/selenodomain-associated transferase 2
MRLSIIVPVLNEEAVIRRFLEHLAGVARGSEVIVVDGGSLDNTVAIAEEYFPVVASPAGRARQMNAGAELASGDVLWFLHADCALPESSCAEIESAMDDPDVAGGCFRLRLPARGLAYRVCDDLGNLAVDILRLTCGDHGIFVRRDAFDAVGGYPDVPIMEDLILSRKLRKAGRLVQLRSYVTAAPRKWERNGPYRTTGIYVLLIALYMLGAPMHVLARIYKRLR